MKDKIFSVRFDLETDLTLRKMAQMRRLNRSKLIRKLIRDEFSNYMNLSVISRKKEKQ